MTYLIYCIFRDRKVPMIDNHMGVDDQPVVQVSNNGLVAAVSRITRDDIEPDVPLIMAYKKVIDSFYREQTVIPMRYGCLLKGKKQVVQLLKKNRSQYEALLKQLDGCVEMGIRVLIEGCTLNIENLKNSKLEHSDPQSAIEKSKISGQTYLANRKTHYNRKDKFTKEIDRIIEKYRDAFSGLYVTFKAEYPSTGNLPFSIINRQSQIPTPLVSLYFLVPRQAIERFRRVFRRICHGHNAKRLMSGPWPPYNFVTHCNGKDTP